MDADHFAIAAQQKKAAGLIAIGQPEPLVLRNETETQQNVGNVYRDLV